MRRIIITLIIMANGFGAAAQASSFSEIAQQCASNVHPQTIAAIVKTESSFNPFAIGVVGGALKRQPRTFDEAQAAVKMLLANGRNFSMGLGQVNRYNLEKYGLNYQTVFDPCKNIKAGGNILAECYNRARKKSNSDQQALQKAFSCYYSGTFTVGFKHGYVRKVVANANTNSNVFVPNVNTNNNAPVADYPQNTNNTNQRNNKVSRVVVGNSSPDYTQDPTPNGQQNQGNQTNNEGVELQRVSTQPQTPTQLVF